MHLDYWNNLIEIFEDLRKSWDKPINLVTQFEHLEGPLWRRVGI